MQVHRLVIRSFILAIISTSAVAGAPDAKSTARGDRLLADYFRHQTQLLTRACLNEVNTLADWKRLQPVYRRQLQEMLGLSPWPKRTPLKATVTGKVEHDEFTVEKLHYQSRPGLYVTANLYVPKKRSGKLPAILYVCGHGRVKKDGVSYGNKVHYQHHGAWFARHGYVCLTIDTLQLGEIEGIHHGTYRYDRWWWNARGYSSAGVEAWNGIRAIDYLQSRPEVDPEKIGITGRSGGGAYSWWVAALDERIKCAVPVAGITSLANHVVDGCVEGHCDCMYQVNTYRWDFPQVAALIAPRPLLISNTDKDRIFPLDGVVDVYFKTRRIYELYKPADKQILNKIGLQITEGPHSDTQELRVHAFRWFDEHLKGETPLIEKPAVKFFKPEDLRVFKELPSDERNTKIDEAFVPTADRIAPPSSQAAWAKQRDGWMKALREKSFRGWPPIKPGSGLKLKPAFAVERRGVRLAAYDFISQQHVPLRLFVAHRAGLKPADLSLVVLNALDDDRWQEFLKTYRPAFAKELADGGLEDAKAFEQTQKMFASFKWAMAYVAPRGIGPTEWNRNARKRVQIRRRFMLLGQTLDGMRVWDVRRGAQALRKLDGFARAPLWMQGHGTAAGWTLYASLFEPKVTRLDLHNLSTSHRAGPIFLNVLRFLDVPQAVAMATERSQVRLYDTDSAKWGYASSTAKVLQWDARQLQIRKPVAAK